MEEGEARFMRDVYPSQEDISKKIDKLWQSLPEKNPDALLAAIIAEVAKSQKTTDDLREALTAAWQGVEGQEELVARAVPCIRAYIQKRFTSEEWSARLRKEFVERGGFTPLTEFLSFGKYENIVHIHVAPAMDQHPVRMGILFRQGLQVLAQRLQEPDMENVEYIQGTSWIIAQAPKMLERLGFTVQPVSDEERMRHFPEEKRPIARATMDRATFLQKFGR